MLTTGLESPIMNVNSPQGRWNKYDGVYGTHNQPVQSIYLLKMKVSKYTQYVYVNIYIYSREMKFIN